MGMWMGMWMGRRIGMGMNNVQVVEIYPRKEASMTVDIILLTIIETTNITMALAIITTTNTMKLSSSNLLPYTEDILTIVNITVVTNIDQVTLWMMIDFAKIIKHEEVGRNEKFQHQHNKVRLVELIEVIQAAAAPAEAVEEGVETEDIHAVILATTHADTHVAITQTTEKMEKT
jgi:hypothetical protein